MNVFKSRIFFILVVLLLPPPRHLEKSNFFEQSKTQTSHIKSSIFSLNITSKTSRQKRHIKKTHTLVCVCRAYKHTHHIREREKDTQRDFYRHSRRRFNQTKHSHPFIVYQTENLKYVTRQRANEPLLGARGATTTARSFFIDIIAAAAAAAAATTTTTTKK